MLILQAVVCGAVELSYGTLTGVSNIKCTLIDCEIIVLVSKPCIIKKDFDK